MIRPENCPPFGSVCTPIGIMGRIPLSSFVVHLFVCVFVSFFVPGTHFLTLILAGVLSFIRGIIKSRVFAFRFIFRGESNECGDGFDNVPLRRLGKSDGGCDYVVPSRKGQSCYFRVSWQVHRG